MPLYEYSCRGCNHRFEALVRTAESPACPSCGSGDLERLLSAFAVSSEGSRQSALNSARRDGAKVRRDKQHAEMEEIQHHSH